MKRGGSAALFATGVLLISSSAAHAFLGWPAIRQALVASSVDPGLVQGIGVGWLYGSAAPLTFGVPTLTVWRSAGSGHASVARVMWPVSALYLLFGGAATIYSSFEPLFLGFIVIGAMAAFAAYAVTRSA